MGGASVLFDTGPLGSGSLFHAPEQIIEAWTAEEVPTAFKRMEEFQRQDKWLAGYAAYELGYVLTPKLGPKLPDNRTVPLLQFGVFDGVVAPAMSGDLASATLARFNPVWDFDTYRNAFEVVRDCLESGDFYQANLTFPLYSQYTGDLCALYERLRNKQSVAHGAFVDLGETKLLSRSPELFFSLNADGQLRAKPMKGTIARGNTPEADLALRGELAASEKDRAENLMIVDLLRNDLSRIAEIGSVQVPALFSVETYATVHQMISEITAQLVPDTSLTKIFSALFPCGSVTGAPKIRAMEVLSEIEAAPRGPYCGSVGWIAPDGSMEFNVAIRTLICDAAGQVTLNVGGGVVYDSTAQSEYAEALLKARFATDLSDG